MEQPPKKLDSLQVNNDYSKLQRIDFFRSEVAFFAIPELLLSSSVHYVALRYGRLNKGMNDANTKILRKVSVIWIFPLCCLRLPVRLGL